MHDVTHQDLVLVNAPEPYVGTYTRLVQRADGYVATIVSGVPVYRDGEATGALPGRLVRGPQPTPASA